MNNRIRLRLLVIAVSMLTIAPTATAQPPKLPPRAGPPPDLNTLKQSHQPLSDEFDQAITQEMMSQRLQELHDLHQLQDRVQELVKDPEFLNNLKLSDEQLRQLREKLLTGKGLNGDGAWNHLLEQIRTRKNWDKGQIDLLHRWAERSAAKSGEVEATKENGVAPDASLPPADASRPDARQSTQTTAEPEQPLVNRIQEESTKWLMENFDDLGGDIVEALTQMNGKDGNGPLAELLRSMRQPDVPDLNLSEHALASARHVESLGQHLSSVGDFLERQSGAWGKVESFFRATPMPSLPRIGSPSVSMPASSASGGDSWLPAVLSLMMLGIIVLLLYTRGLGSKASDGSGANAEWRLGSWPVSPGGVSTRQDVIRAFEYLALLCLGPTAASCHHHELAERLAAYPPDSEGVGGEASRRQAAETLAWLYEQARYAPTTEPLSSGQLTDARHALCYLAGVTAA